MAHFGKFTDFLRQKGLEVVVREVEDKELADGTDKDARDFDFTEAYEGIYEKIKDLKLGSPLIVNDHFYDIDRGVLLGTTVSLLLSRNENYEETLRVNENSWEPEKSSIDYWVKLPDQDEENFEEFCKENNFIKEKYGLIQEYFLDAENIKQENLKEEKYEDLIIREDKTNEINGIFVNDDDGKYSIGVSMTINGSNKDKVIKAVTEIRKIVHDFYNN